MGAPWSRFLLHHDPDAATGATGVRAFLGEAWVHQVSVTLHTTGALLIAGALAAVLYLRTVHYTAPAASGWTDDARRRLRNLVFWGWGLNFGGGIMRLYEPDHPGLTSAPEVAWVNVLLIKHLALLGAIVFSLFAVELAPAAWRERHRLSAGLALGLVLFASIAGGVATGLPLPDTGMGAMDDGVMSGNGGADAFSEPVVTWRNSTVQLTGTPVAPAVVEMPIDLPEATTELVVGLTWSMQTTVVTAVLVDPDGETVAESGEVSDTEAELSLTKNTFPGTYTLRVSSDRAVGENVAVSARITQGGVGIRVLEETVTVRYPGFEINLYMDEGEWFQYEWSVASGDPEIAWDIHSHPDGEVVEHESGTNRTAEGNFTAGDHEVYSIFWKPEPNQIVTVTYRVEGPFRVHSIYRGA